MEGEDSSEKIEKVEKPEASPEDGDDMNEDVGEGDDETEGLDSEGRNARKPTEEIAMKLRPQQIISKLTYYYQEFIRARAEIHLLQKEFGKLDRKRNRWKASHEELQLRLIKRRELREKTTAFELINLKIRKLREAAFAKEITSLPPEPPPLEEDEEDPCLPDDILPRVIVCNGYRVDWNDNMADMPKIVVCLDDRCKKLPPESEVVEDAKKMNENNCMQGCQQGPPNSSSPQVTSQSKQPTPQSKQMTPQSNQGEANKA